MKKTQSANSIFQDLLQEIQHKNEVKLVSDKFSKLKSNYERVTFAYELLEKYKLFPELIFDKKCDELAVQLREEGNIKFKNKRLKEAVDFYTESLGYSCSFENYSKALANRSAALFELELYEECLTDINKALEHHYPEDLKPKLLRRKEKVFQSKSLNNENKYYNPIPDILDESKSNSIQCASNSVEIKYSESQGRHIVATRNINIGEILAVETPFCQILVSEYFNHCHNCLKLCYNLLPCEHCTRSFYCNENCRKNALKYHKYECNILKTLLSLELDKMKLLPLKISLVVKNLYPTISKITQIDPNEMYKSDEYKEIHNLIGNTDTRTVADLFKRSTTAAVIFSLIKNNADFFSSDEDETIFKELLLLHFQTASCNFHEISELAKNEKGYYETEEIGAGAFSFLSLFNHSCNPNVVRHCYGNAVVVRAIQSIGKGEQCYDNYGYHFAVMPKLHRTQNLKKQYFFDCNCNVCENNWPLLSDLPFTDVETGVTAEDITSLRKGNKKIAESVLGKLLPKMQELEKIQPNKLFFEMQEVLKQCYALLGHVRRF